MKFVSDMNPQNTPARLSFFNFLRAFGTPEADLTPQFIELFFHYCLDYPHWNDNKSQLGHEVKFLLENFNQRSLAKINLKEIQFPQNSQVVEVEHFADCLDLVSNFMKRTISNEDKFRLLPDTTKRVIALVQKEDRSLQVRCFDRKFMVRRGELEPLRKDLCLHYTSQLELSSDHVQKVELAPYITAQFRIVEDRIQGNIIRGYVYQKLMELKGEILSEQPRLFVPIKRLEQFFVDRKTDPYYLKLTSQLERCRHLVQQGDPQAISWSETLLSDCETALEHIFIGDKFLQLLVRDLAHTVAQFKTGPFATTLKSSISASGKKGISSPDYIAALGSIKNDFKTGSTDPEIEEECLKIAPLKELDSIN